MSNKETPIVISDSDIYLSESMEYPGQDAHSNGDHESCSDDARTHTETRSEDSETVESSLARFITEGSDYSEDTEEEYEPDESEPEVLQDPSDGIQNGKRRRLLLDSDPEEGLAPPRRHPVHMDTEPEDEPPRLPQHRPNFFLSDLQDPGYWPDPPNDKRLQTPDAVKFGDMPMLVPSPGDRILWISSAT